MADLVVVQVEHPPHTITGMTADPGPPQNLQDEMSPSSPVTHTPPEVLSYIFRLLVPFYKSKVNVTLPAQGPFCLAQVCRRWRMITESDPHLWSFMHFYVPDLSRPIRIVPRVKLMFDLHLKRSGTLPISLDYRDCRNPSYMDELIFLLVDELRMHSHRWKSVSLELPHEYFPHLSTFTPCDLSSLEHLLISGHDSEFTGLNLGSAKNLKSCAYCGPGNQLVTKIDLRWEQLEKASFQYLPDDTSSGLSLGHIECLFLCRNLITCSLNTHYYTNELSKIILPRLQTLRIRLSNEPNKDSIIGVLFLPQLQTLEIDSKTTSPRVPPLRYGRIFPDLLRRSKCSLRHLSIEMANLSSDEIWSCLNLSDKLLSFRYIPYPLSKDDCREVIYQLKVLQHRQRPLVPELQEITLGTSVQAHLDTMMAVFRSRAGSSARAAGVATLERVEVMFLYDTKDYYHREVLPLEVTASVNLDLAQWVSAMEKEKTTGVVVHMETRPYNSFALRRGRCC